MSYPGDPTDDETTSSGLSTYTPLSVEAAKEYGGATKDYNAGLAARHERLAKEYFAPQTKLWDDYAEAIKNRRAGPDFSERMYQLSAALMKPTTYQGFGATIGNIAPVVAQQQAAMREAEDAKQELLMKYKLQSQTVQGEQLKSLLASEDAQAKASFAARLAQLKAASKEGKSPEVGVDPLRGTVYRKDTGATIKSANPLDVKDLIQHVIDGRGPEARLVFDKTYGTGAADLYIKAAQRNPNGGY